MTGQPMHEPRIPCIGSGKAHPIPEFAPYTSRDSNRCDWLNELMQVKLANLCLSGFGIFRIRSNFGKKIAIS